MEEATSLLGAPAETATPPPLSAADAAYNVRVMGGGFLLLFAAYNTVQTTDTTLLSGYTGDVTGATYDLGAVSLVADWNTRAA